MEGNSEQTNFPPWTSSCSVAVGISAGVILLLAGGAVVFSVLTGLLALASAHAGAITLGGAAGTAVEAALPWVTRGMRVRKAARIANRVSRRMVGRGLKPFEREEFTREFTRDMTLV